MLIAVLVLCILGLLVSLWAVMLLLKLEGDFDSARIDLTTLRKQSEQPYMGGLRMGRSIPSAADLEAARNRIDAQGTAHPGGSS